MASTKIKPEVGKLLWKYLPETSTPPSQLEPVIDAFKSVFNKINSEKNNCKSNEALAIVGNALHKCKTFYIEGIDVSKSKGKLKKIRIDTGQTTWSNKKKFFCPDGMSKDEEIILEIEAGQAVDNYRFLKDYYEASIFTPCKYLVIAVRNIYSTTDKNGKVTSQYDYDTVCRFFEAMYKSNAQSRIEGVLIIGY